MAKNLSCLEILTWHTGAFIVSWYDRKFSLSLSSRCRGKCRKQSLHFHPCKDHRFIIDKFKSEGSLGNFSFPELYTAYNMDNSSYIHLGGKCYNKEWDYWQHKQYCLLGNYQPGFSKGKSYWKCATVRRGEGKPMGIGGPREIIQLGFQKAFDKVPHQSLLKQHPQIAGHDKEDRWKTKHSAEFLPMVLLCIPYEGDDGVRRDPKGWQLKWRRG